jgi:hypothetical protein
MPNVPVLKHRAVSLLSAAHGPCWASDGGFDTFLSHHKQHGGSSGILLSCNGNWRIKYDRRFRRYLGRARKDAEIR